jgi:hypothetical protein
MDTKFRDWMHSIGIKKYDDQLPEIFAHVTKTFAKKNHTVQVGRVTFNPAFFGDLTGTSPYVRSSELTLQQPCASACSQPALGRVAGGSTRAHSASANSSEKARAFISHCLSRTSIPSRTKSIVISSAEKKLNDLVNRHRKRSSLKVVDFFDSIV